jgi:predicted site-specific integrase-resolvase
MIIIKLLILFIVMSNFIGGKQASELLGVHQRTLMNWDKIGKIETIRTSGNKRLYNVSKY